MSALRKTLAAPTRRTDDVAATAWAVTPATRWPEHDRAISAFHRAGMVPVEIAVRLDGLGLRVRTWQVTESFVRSRQKILGLVPNSSRDIYSHGPNLYRARSRPAAKKPPGSARSTRQAVAKSSNRAGL